MSNLNHKPVIKNIPLKDIKPYSNNPRKKQNITKVVNSIKEFGFQQPIVVDKKNIIIVGHSRYEAGKELGLDKVPVIIADLSPVKAKAYRIADNRINQDSEWDFSKLTLEFKDISKLDFNLDSLGFEKNELDDLIIDEVKGFTDDDAVPDKPKKPKSKLGEIYQLGNHRLMCGDATKEEDVNKLMNGQKADICFTSPPYNADKNSHLTGEVKGFDKKYINIPDNLSDDKYLELIKKSTDMALSISEYVFVNLQLLTHNRIPLIEFQYHFKNQLKDILIWNKSIAPPNIVKGSFNTKYEFLFCISNDTNTRGFPCNWQGKYPNVIETESNSTNEFANKHKAVFPVSFPLWIIEKMDFSMSVYDYFMGTGTTLIACEKLNRKCFGMELDPIYVDVIIKRWEDYTGKSSKKI